MARPFVAFHVTERCARSCAHCLRDPAGAPRDLPAALFARVLDEARDAWGISHAGLTGGEPALHPELPALLDAVAARGMTLHLVSSGGGFVRLLDALDAAPPRLEAVERVDLSLDGATEAVHDALRGAGSFREVNAAALACHARGIPFTVQMAVNARNEGDVEAVGLAAAQLGAERVSYGPTFPTGAEDAPLFLPADRLAAVADRVARLGEVLRMPVGAAAGFPERPPARSCPPWRGEVLHVDPMGRLSLCCNHSGTPGPADDAVADLAATPLAQAHLRLLDLVHRLEREEGERIAAGDRPAGFDLSLCNRCLRRMGKPHWTEAGAAGPRARRARAPYGASPGASKKPA